MTNFVFVLLFVLFPPPEVVQAQPDSEPLVQAAATASLEDCKADAAKALAAAAQQFPGAVASVACIQVPAPDYKPVKPGLQPDGNVLTPDGDVVAPRGPI